LHSSTLSEGIKNQCKQMWSFLKFSSVEANFVFSRVTSLIS